ncbi:hypothetical protein TcasGA2_TC001826 [Tribolium castaneum]|uniref:Transposable element P transposase-like RNase H domain-containing protein n=1 Tax=Tribolium castaneum TaxID=7070 RepID=A0A139W8U6_TRICA|nr:hypothetical protein TcasGA2_TC001826 [Tribolium castaneum]
MIRLPQEIYQTAKLTKLLLISQNESVDVDDMNQELGSDGDNDQSDDDEVINVVPSTSNGSGIGQNLKEEIITNSINVDTRSEQKSNGKGKSKKASRYNLDDSTENLSNETTNPQVIETSKKIVHPKVRWTNEQKKVTKAYFKRNIQIRKPPTESEIEEFRKKYPIMENKDWKKIKIVVFVIDNIMEPQNNLENFTGDNIEPQPGPSWADPTNSIEPQPGPSGVSLQNVVFEKRQGPKSTRKSEPLIQRAGLSSGTVLNEREKKLLKFAKILNSRIRRLGKNLQSTKAAHKLYKEENVRHVIENLTPVQQRFILSQLRNVGRAPQGRNFTFEEKADAVAFYKSSLRGYKFLSSIWALPSVRTLQATLNKVPIRSGISKHTFKILSKQKWKDERDRICTLIFDEIQIQPHLDYLPEKDKVVGFEDDGTTRTRAVADHVAVFMIRGVYKRWKQPVAFAFCKSAMKASSIVGFFKQIIIEATEAGLYVIASVCDMGSNNIKTIADLIDSSKQVRSSEDEVVLNNVIRVPLPDGKYQEVIPLFDPPHL